MNYHKEQWESFLNPEKLKNRLINISMYITIYEMLKDSIINRIKDFYIVPFMDHIDDLDLLEYKNQVLSKHKNPLYASLQWLEEMLVLDKADLKKIDELKAYRNYLAHEMSVVVFTGDVKNLHDKFLSIYQLIHKIENWWIINYEIELTLDPVNIDEIDAENIQSGKKIMIDMALMVLEGNEELLKKFKEVKS